MALPVDLVPDVIPVLGYADDVIVIGRVLHSVARAAGPEALTRHWPGTPDGLAAVRRLVGSDRQGSAPPTRRRPAPVVKRLGRREGARERSLSTPRCLERRRRPGRCRIERARRSHVWPREGYV